eukprot:CAMPEP_0204440206 /NCGR_PEP_ID=MMETSP0470-20130426/82826_1 /ASSEMBLY_ACC=CAM_ASM_000385 /TAXON_ID=2969 /ORGANISM="Oxyrrhis marina" /LENGTH=97 /DNA_ID=CAMNT_0051439191 /DNA_START=160 /DNA_END=453 /DNA_ORIENTATION=+
MTIPHDVKLAPAHHVAGSRECDVLGPQCPLKSPAPSEPPGRETQWDPNPPPAPRANAAPPRPPRAVRDRVGVPTARRRANRLGNSAQAEWRARGRNR